MSGWAVAYIRSRAPSRSSLSWLTRLTWFRLSRKHISVEVTKFFWIILHSLEVILKTKCFFHDSMAPLGPCEWLKQKTLKLQSSVLMIVYIAGVTWSCGLLHSDRFWFVQMWNCTWYFTALFFNSMKQDMFFFFSFFFIFSLTFIHYNIRQSDGHSHFKESFLDIYHWVSASMARRWMLFHFWWTNHWNITPKNPPAISLSRNRKTILLLFRRIHRPFYEEFSLELVST